MALALGIAGTLLGVVIGAFLTRWIDFAYERRREVRQAVVSALILREELKDIEAGLRVIVNQREGSTNVLFTGVQEWDAHRENLLAVNMPHRDWSELGKTFRYLLEVTRAVHDPELAISDDDVEFLEEIRKECNQGRELLGPFIVEARIPFILPLSVFTKPARG